MLWRSGSSSYPWCCKGAGTPQPTAPRTLDPQLARYAFAVGNLTFTNAWVAMGSFAIACGWVMVSTGFLPRWLGWLAIVGGGGLVLARGVRLNEVGFLPYGLFWLWVIVCSVLLIRHAGLLPVPTGP